MIPPNVAQIVMQLAQQAGQTVQQFIASNPDVIKKLVHHGAIEVFKKIVKD